MTARLPDGLAARPPRMADVDAVVALLRDDERATVGDPHTSVADVRSDWSRPSVDLGTDVVLVHDGSRLVGYAEQHDGRAWVAVDPDHCGRGIGTWLLGWTEAQARRQGLPRVGQAIATTATVAAELLAAHGYEPRWESWIFAIPLEQTTSPAALPDGMVLRPMRRPEEDRAVHDVIETAFSDWPDRDSGMSLEDWRAAHLDRGDVDVLVISDGEALVGAAVCIEEEGADEGWIEQLAVARALRGQGLGRALLHGAFARFAAHGLATAGLSTDSRTGARALYEHVGMAVTSSWIRWSRELG